MNRRRSIFEWSPAGGTIAAFEFTERRHIRWQLANDTPSAGVRERGTMPGPVQVFGRRPPQRVVGIV
jgi:hypothetical protein